MNKLFAFIILLVVIGLACSNTPITPEPTANKPAAPTYHIPDTSTMVVCVDALNVRTGAGTGNTITTEPLERGTIVTITGTVVISQDMGLWQEITQPVRGWVNVKHLCEVD